MGRRWCTGAVSSSTGLHSRSVTASSVHATPSPFTRRPSPIAFRPFTRRPLLFAIQPSACTVHRNRSPFT
eukprot:2995737-Prymnesium_polylepis.1